VDSQCNNPLTKRPKLENALSIEEWPILDAEVKAFEKKLEEQEKGLNKHN
jgi:hypothetical protein